MKHFFLIGIFLCAWHISKAQTGIDGVFVLEGNDYYYELTLKPNFNYRMRSGTCIHHVFDTGTYQLQHDTLEFYSILKPDQLINRKIKIGMGFSPIDTSIIDTIFFRISNESDFIQHDLVIRDSTNILINVPILAKGEFKNFVIRMGKNAQTMHLWCSVGTLVKEIPTSNSVSLMIYTDRTYTNSQTSGRYLYSGDKIYWLDLNLKKKVSKQPHMIRQK